MSNHHKLLANLHAFGTPVELAAADYNASGWLKTSPPFEDRSH